MIKRRKIIPMICSNHDFVLMCFIYSFIYFFKKKDNSCIFPREKIMAEPIIPSQEAEKVFGSISRGRSGKRNISMLAREVPDSLGRVG